jgi:hypothetical protein
MGITIDEYHRGLARDLVVGVGRDYDYRTLFHHRNTREGDSEMLHSSTFGESLLATTLVVVSVFAIPVSAGFTFESNEAAFDAANGALNMINFDDQFGSSLVDGIYFPGAGDFPISVGGQSVNIVGDVVVLDPSYTGSDLGVQGSTFSNLGSAYLATTGADVDVTFEFSDAPTAVGFNLGSLRSLVNTVQIEIGFDDGSIQLVTADTAFPFVGFTFDTGISEMSMRFVGDFGGGEPVGFFGIDNFRFGSAGTHVPLPGAALLAVLGFCGVAIRRHDRGPLVR